MLYIDQIANSQSNAGLVSFLLSQRWRLGLFFIVISILFIAAFIPSIGIKAAPWHVEVHLLTYATVSILAYWTLSGLKFYWLWSIIILVPIAHEVCEIWGHYHRLEVNDIITNLIGTGIGILFVLGFLKIKKTDPK